MGEKTNDTADFSVVSLEHQTALPIMLFRLRDSAFHYPAVVRLATFL
jgi:hypothetical protein